jgi:hypothetical protein
LGLVVLDLGLVVLDLGLVDLVDFLPPPKVIFFSSSS